MELRENYNKNELSEIPEGWVIRKLGSIGTFSKGQGIRKDQSNSGSIPCIRYGELYTRHHNVIKEFFSGISYDIALTSKKLVNGSILFAGSGETKSEIGKCAAYISNNETYAGGDIVILEKHNQNPVFLGYMLNAPRIQQQKASRGQGDAVVHISGKQLGEIQVPLPPLVEQNEIAAALTDIDSLIVRTEKLIEKKKAIKQGMMQKFFTPYDTNGKLKEGWKLFQLKEVITVYRGGSPRPIQSFLTTNSNGINWIKIGDTSVKEKFITSAQEKIIDEGISRSRMVFAGDFLLSNSMSFGRPYILKIDGCIHDGWLVLQEYQNTFDCDYLYYLLSSHFVLEQYLSLAAGSSVLNLNKEIVGNVILFKPKSKSEQISIANSINSVEQEINLLNEKHYKLLLIKQAMMQSLLTGKIRIHTPYHAKSNQV